jgi:hypothetical protein
MRKLFKNTWQQGIELDPVLTWVLKGAGSAGLRVRGRRYEGLVSVNKTRLAVFVGGHDQS